MLKLFLAYCFNFLDIYKINNKTNKKLKSKINIIFQIEHKGQYQFISSLLNQILKDEKYNKILISTNNDLNFLKKKLFDKKILIIKGSISYFIKNINICIKCNFEDIKPKNSISIYVGHGFLGKRNFISKKYFEDINNIFLYGPSHFNILKYYIKKNNFDLKKIKFWKAGYPNYDDQFNNVYNILKIKRELNIKNNKINILYAPSWENNASLRNGGDQIIKAFTKLQNYNFIVKLHPTLLVSKLKKFYTGGTDWHKKFISLEKKYTNIYYYKETKINPLFKVAQLMITDYSSVALGFMLENKPVIFYNPKKFSSDHLESLGYDKNFKKNPMINNGMNYGLSINNIFEINSAIQEVTKNKKLYLKKIRNLKKHILYNPGRGSKFSYNFLNRIIYTQFKL